MGYVQNGEPPLWAAAMAETGADRMTRLGAVICEEERLASHVHGGWSVFGHEPAATNRGDAVAKLPTRPGGLFRA